jgi:hypothetical protein
MISVCKQIKKYSALTNLQDLHNGAGLSDLTQPNGNLTIPIFEQIEYDFLTIGNHELRSAEIAYMHYNQFAKYYGERYITSNVEILDPHTGKWEHIGSRFHYFRTEQGPSPCHIIEQHLTYTSRSSCYGIWCVVRYDRQ